MHLCPFGAPWTANFDIEEEGGRRAANEDKADEAGSDFSEYEDDGKDSENEDEEEHDEDGDDGRQSSCERHNAAAANGAATLLAAASVAASVTASPIFAGTAEPAPASGPASSPKLEAAVHALLIRQGAASHLGLEPAATTDQEQQQQQQEEKEQKNDLTLPYGLGTDAPQAWCNGCGARRSASLGERESGWFTCIVCPCFDVCSGCRYILRHPHQLVQRRAAGAASGCAAGSACGGDGAGGVFEAEGRQVDLLEAMWQNRFHVEYALRTYEADLGATSRARVFLPRPHPPPEKPRWKPPLLTIDETPPPRPSLSLQP